MAGQGRLAVEDSLGSLVQVAAGEDKPDLGLGKLEEAAAGGSPGEVAEGNPEEGTPVEELGSTVVEGSPVLPHLVEVASPRPPPPRPCTTRPPGRSRRQAPRQKCC